ALQSEPLPPFFELEAIHKNGTRIPLEVSARFLYAGERAVSIVCVLRDITLKKKLEQQRNDFLAMLTHDIKNPVSVVLGYTELLLEDAGRLQQTEQKKMLLRLRSNALTVHSLVTNYLDLSKIESGHLTLARQPLGINTVLRAVVQQYEAEANRHGLTVQLDCREDVPAVNGDPLALERVCANLLHNAVKFTPKGGRIIVRSGYDGRDVFLSITDTGPGISSEEVSSLFEKYQ